jgi:ABC-type uncharacterized transport system substrate-binding protein
MKVLVFILVASLSLFAHPHFFIDVDVNLQKDKIVQSWYFDKLNSKLLSFELDKNKDKIFQKDEQKQFYDTYITKGKENNFNLFLEENGKEHTFSSIENYDLKLEKRRVVFSFEIATNEINELTLCNIDPTIYMAFKLNKIDSKLNTQTQKSEYDFCIGASK